MSAPAPRVLLVEDNALNRYLASFLLEAAGAVVLTAEDGAAGIETARRLQPDLIVMDIEMPVMDGYEAARTLLGDPATRHIPIVAASSYLQAGDRAAAAEIGFVDYIEKPIDSDTFAERVLAALRRPPGATPPPGHA